MKVITFSTLYPNATQARHGIFVETRLRHLLANGKVESKVIAPVPWFPFTHRIFGKYADFAKVQRYDLRHGIDVYHPHYFHLPKIGMSISPFFLALSSITTIAKLIRQGYDFDLIDAHYFYPDGVAAIILGRIFNKPVVITARGTDLNLLPQYVLPRNMIKWAAKNSAAMITVCQALKDVLIDLGIHHQRITTLRNGVDLKLFSPTKQRDELREQLSIRQKTILSVGHLIERKGHDLIIKALLKLPNVKLLIAGDGEQWDYLQNLVSSLHLNDQVTFLGALTQSQLRDYYAAADILVLASSREGWANVLLESMACGTPVVATNVWGTPEIIRAPEAGVLVHRDENDIAQGIENLFANYPNREATRRYAENFSWDETTSGQETLFSQIIKAII